MRAVFLDRDGVINSDRDDYVKNVGELRVYSFAPQAILRLNEAGWPVFVISNQQGVAKGIISEDDLQKIQREIAKQVAAAGGKITAFYYCKHLASEKCSCRKPQPGLLLSAAKEHGIDLCGSVMVGDSERDLVAGAAAGCRTVLVLTGKLTREDTMSLACKPDFVANTLAEASDYILNL